ncbi:MAG TPA: alkaline phosphatase D family protein [Candidatus Cybelea sp.]|nr:alkaline phosphatase D family protein [Candidatus Cybelea sp.]
MKIRFAENRVSRRRFLRASAATGLVTLAAPRISRAAARPMITHGIQSGDAGPNSAMLWSRTDRPANAIFEWATTDSFKDSTVLPKVAALPEADFTAKILATDLPGDQEIFYRVKFQDLSDTTVESDPLQGHFRTAPAGLRDVSFAWSGDTAGQGWGIDVDRGGMKCYSTVLKHDPDFFIHSGDNVYADGVLKPEVKLPDGTTWKNLVTPEKSKVAETLDEFRGQYKYNFTDKNVLALYQQVPVFAQWDDHEVMNNWSDSKAVPDAYTEKSIAVLSARAAQAFHEYMPIPDLPEEPQRVYRKIAYGPLLDVFMLDMRRYRGPNGDNLQTTEGGEAAFLGATQLAWLKRGLLTSKATWKVIAADMPLSLIVWNDATNMKGFEAVANHDDGKPLGRELEFADLFRFMKAAGIKNTIWLTADVHYTAAHYYNPDKAQFQDFDPFWEFVSGPIHAGTFGPNDLDQTFGPEVKFVKAPGADHQNLSPAAGMQFFGHVKIAGATGVMTVTLRDTDDNALWSVDLEPQRA